MIRQLLTTCGTTLLLALVQTAVAQPIAAETLHVFVQREASAAIAARDQVRIDVKVGQLDSRLQLAPCARIEPFLPAGTRLWGRANVGLRCVQGAQWSVLVPVTVRVHGPALVALRPLPAQSQVQPDDLRVAEVEWTREAQGVVTDLVQLDGRVLARPVAAGQAIPLAALRTPLAISQGDPVKLVGTGRGFTISAEAVALASAHEGQSVRVRTESGRIVSGTARAGRQVEVLF